VSGDLLEISPDEPTAISEEAPPEDPGPSSSRHIPLRSINAVAVHIPSIDSARSKVTADMESMVLEGLSQVASSFPYPDTWRFLTLSPEPATTCDFTSNCAQPPPVAGSCTKSCLGPFYRGRSPDQSRVRRVSDI
jgi:hypothetical protein